MEEAPDQGVPSAGIVAGFPDRDRDEIAHMYWAAFGGKLGLALRPRATAIALLSEVVDPDCAIVARGADGRLLGVAGYKTAHKSFVSIDFARLRRHYGLVGAIWRGLLLALLKRPLEPETLTMDGIVVAQHARGQGVGAALLGALEAKARAEGLRRAARQSS